MSGPGAYVNLARGDPAPWFHARSSGNPRYNFSSAAGRYLVLCFFGTAADRRGQAAIDAMLANRRRFDDHTCAFFGVSLDPADETERRVTDSLPGVRYFWDADGAVSRLYGALPSQSEAEQVQPTARRLWIVLDPTLRILAVIPFAEDGSDAAKVFALLENFPPPARFAGVEIQAPIIFLPNVFEPQLCRRLIELYEREGGKESGFMREVGGKTVLMEDYGHKRRRDHTLADQAAIDATRSRVLRRIVPEIQKIYQFKVTRMERYIVSCYAADDGGHFNAHRDNTTKGTAHRRFAVTVNLNDDYDGGELNFPEYGPRSFKPPVGGAVVFSCSLLHAATLVTRGRRYAFLPFLYDDAAAKIRETNNQFLDASVGAYKGS